MYDVVIIGAGVIGGTLARELSKYQLSVCILEKENDVAMGASKANSGIIHGGFDPLPGTLKAKLNVSGVPLLYEAAKQLNVPCKNNGSMVLAFNETDDKTVKMLYDRGIKNGVTDMKIITGDEARKLEKSVSENVTSCLLINSAGIICPYELTVAAIGNAMDNGAELKRNFNVTKIEKTDGFTVVSENGEKVFCRYLVNCAGVNSDKISVMAGDNFFGIIPRAGEYMLLDKKEGKTVSHTVFQVPTENGKGVLVTPTADGNLLLGPTATLVDGESETKTTKTGLSDVENLAKKSVPNVNAKNVITSFSGVRASEKSGDFIISASKKVKNFINVAAIDSPGLSSSVAIAKYTVDILKNEGLALKINPDFNGNREDTFAFKKMTDEQKDAYIKVHPEYGKIVCRCETVSEGEIKDAITRNPKATDVDGVKRRTRSGMGRCQGGFCMPYVMGLIAKENNIPLDKVTKKGKNSEIVTGKL